MARTEAFAGGAAAAMVDPRRKIRQSGAGWVSPYMGASMPPPAPMVSAADPLLPSEPAAAGMLAGGQFGGGDVMAGPSQGFDGGAMAGTGDGGGGMGL